MLAVLLLVGVDSRLSAQQLTLKQTLPSPIIEGCPPFRPPAPVERDDREQARTLLAEAQREVLAGQRTAALRLLADAAHTDPASSEVAYHRARLLEDIDDPRSAAAEYCRALALAPRAADASEIQQRFRALGTYFPGRPSPVVADQFRYGIEYLARGDAYGADRAFSYVIMLRPDLAEAYFNRALSHATAGRRAPAAQDLESYLVNAPYAPDRDLIRQVVRNRLAPPDPPAQQALVRGLLFPGLAQYSAGRTSTGAAFTMGAAAGLVLALQTRERDAAMDSPDAGDRFHPHLAAGIALAATMTVAGAVEAYLHTMRDEARRARSIVRTDESSLSVAPTVYVATQGIGLGIRLSRGFY